MFTQYNRYASNVKAPPPPHPSHCTLPTHSLYPRSATDLPLFYFLSPPIISHYYNQHTIFHIIFSPNIPTKPCSAVLILACCKSQNAGAVIPHSSWPSIYTGDTSWVLLHFFQGSSQVDHEQHSPKLCMGHSLLTKYPQLCKLGTLNNCSILVSKADQLLMFNEFWQLLSMS